LIELEGRLANAKRQLQQTPRYVIESPPSQEAVVRPLPGPTKTGNAGAGSEPKGEQLSGWDLPALLPSVEAYGRLRGQYEAARRRREELAEFLESATWPIPAPTSWLAAPARVTERLGGRQARRRLVLIGLASLWFGSLASLAVRRARQPRVFRDVASVRRCLHIPVVAEIPASDRRS
jgi:hypothetical protein